MHLRFKHLKKGFRVFSAAFTIALLLVMYTPAANYMARPLVVAERLGRADLIVVLGGGIYRNGDLSAQSKERLIKGLVTLRDGYAPRILFSGGAFSGPVGRTVHTLSGGAVKRRRGAHEAEAMKDTALRLGLPAEAIRIDPASQNTYENLLGAEDLMRREGLTTCILVTSPVHMMRALLVARRLGITAYPAPVADYTPYRDSAMGRLVLLGRVVHEYGGLALYKVYGYI